MKIPLAAGNVFLRQGGFVYRNMGKVEGGCEYGICIIFYD